MATVAEEATVPAEKPAPPQEEVSKEAPESHEQPTPAPEAEPEEHQHHVLEAESTDESNTSDFDYDSLYGTDEEGASATTSLSDSVRNYRYENGRRYHAYKAGAWVFPNDEIQLEQMDLFHHIFMLRLKGKLFLAPIEHPQKIMDVGTGTGIWAMQVAEEFEGAAVMGNDLSPVQPTWVPPNILFEVDDFNEPWLHTPESYDFIHSRDLHMAVDDWTNFVGQVYEKLKPGGWYESQEHTVEITSDDGSVPEDNVLKAWVRGLEKISDLIKKDCHPHKYIDQKMKDAGFINLHKEYFKLPIGTWPQSKVDKEIGAFNLVNMLEAAEGFTLKGFTEILGWEVPVVQKMIVDIRKNLKKKDFHMYFRFCVIYGQKPE
ncbi:hypothetical protein TWF694_002919 [Orbilia ellipsospora]|uniref:Methyltransferase n=1 Tax=Orbilia ellipsospora TaxID=2528407 RepID=A0AAV9X049_9PEZI